MIHNKFPGYKAAIHIIVLSVVFIGLISGCSNDDTDGPFEIVFPPAPSVPNNSQSSSDMPGSNVYEPPVFDNSGNTTDLQQPTPSHPTATVQPPEQNPTQSPTTQPTPTQVEAPTVNNNSISIPALQINEHPRIATLQKAEHPAIPRLQTNATAITNNATVLTYNGNITSDNQVDEYSFVALSNGQYRFEISGQSVGQVNIAVLDSTGNRLDRTQWGVNNGDGLTIGNIVANATYTVQVSQYSNRPQYTLSVGMQKDSVDITGFSEVSDSIQFTGQINIYTYTAPSSGQYRFEITGQSGGQVNIAVLDSTGNRLDRTQWGVNNGDGLTISSISTGATYTIHVLQYSNKSPYILSIGTQKETVNITGFNEVSDSIQFNGQINSYTYTAPSSGQYRFEITGQSGGQVNIAVVDSTGNRLDRTQWGVNNGDGLTISNIVAGTTYTIQVSQYSNRPPYTLNIGTQKETVNITGFTEVSDSIQFNGQINSYTYTAPSSGQYRFEVTGQSGGQVNIAVFDSTGNRLDRTQWGVNNGDGLTISNIVAGTTYTIQVMQYSNRPPYKLSIGTQKETVNITGLTEVKDSIQFNGQINIYTYTAPSSGQYRFEITGQSGGQVNIAVFESTGNRLDRTQWGVNNGDGLTISNISAGSTYTIHIMQYSNRPSYNLRVTKQ
jgi:hypothetical protein